MLDQLKCLIEYQKIEDKKNQLIRSYEEAPRRIAELERCRRSRRGLCVGGGRVHDYSKRGLDKRLGRFNGAVKVQAECWAAGAHKKAGRAYGRDFFTRLARCQSLYILEFCKD